MVATFYKIVAISDRYIETVTNLVGNDFLLSLIAMVFLLKSSVLATNIQNRIQFESTTVFSVSSSDVFIQKLSLLATVMNSNGYYKIVIINEPGGSSVFLKQKSEPDCRRRFWSRF